MKKPFFSLVVLLLALPFFTSCDKNMVFDKFHHIDGESWAWDQPVNFLFQIDDTLSYNNIIITVRHSTDYPLSNLYMFVHLNGPSGQSVNDTINFMLARNNGKWIGVGIGNLREIAYLYRKNTLFPEPGEYELSLEQAMRLQEVPVSEIGVRVEKMNSK